MHLHDELKLNKKSIGIGLVKFHTYSDNNFISTTQEEIFSQGVITNFMFNNKYLTFIPTVA